ncbi:hypothetical protein [Brevundimonas sp. SORGH_AS_0993]|uniref:hypothetical protein n=1 Tax=Brevundimonas sp. SORGH_AS_0993 TaxID=3041794 RepID=UPI00277E534F|nr:hypothetical protein [Brevundimonas sp. SORGH_AS_0993]MDQ1153368.1 MFS family permease [Brevundimonas sp. SORGH_AS_0993]
MVETFSIIDALRAPLRVIRRHPLTVFVWGLLIVGFVMAMMLMVFGALADIPLSPNAEPPPQLMGQFIAMQGVSMLLNLEQLVLGVMVWAATMRATFRIGRPERYFFLRAGMDEVRLAVVGLALFAGAYAAVIAFVIVAAVLSALIWQFSQTAALMVGGVLFLAMIAGVALAMARVSMIAPATLLLRRFAFREGWALGKRRVWRLFGLLVSTWLIYMLVYFVLAFGVIVTLFFSGAFAGLADAQDATTFGELFPSPTVLGGVAAFILLPGSFVYGAVITLLNAPFAAACRELLDGAPQDADRTIV